MKQGFKRSSFVSRKTLAERVADLTSNMKRNNWWFAAATIEKLAVIGRKGKA